MKVLFRYSLFLVLFIGVFPISCFLDCPDPMGYIIEPTALSIRVQNKYGSENSDTLPIYSGSPSTLYFRISISGNQIFVTENESPNLLIGQSASATSKCDPYYFIEHKPGLKNLEISCNKDLFSHLANSSLNDELAVLVEGYTASKNDTFSMAQFNDSLLSNQSFLWNSFYHSQNIQFFFKDDVPKGIYQFKFEMKLEDGPSLEGLSPWISIE